MTSIHCAPLLAAILLLIPAALAQSPAEGQSLLDQPLSGDVALPSLGGQLTSGVDMAFAVSADKAPRTVNTGAVTLGFSSANAVPISGQVIVTLPKGYFSNVDSTKVNTFTGTSSTCKCVQSAGDKNDVMTCTVAGAALAGGAVTLSMAVGALTTGAPTAASTYTVSTSVDRAVTAATQQIGGVITGLDNLDFKNAAADKVPGTVNTGLVNAAFTVVNAVPIGGTLTLNVPSKYFTNVDSTKVNTFAGKTTATCVLKTATATDRDSVICTTAVAVLETGSQVLSLIAGAVTTGAPTADGEYKVQTSTDRESTAKTAPALGSILDKTGIADMVYASASTDAVPNTLNTGKISLKFATTKTELPIGGKITIALPRNYFSKVDETKDVTFTTANVKAKCVRTAGAIGTKVFEIDGADTIVCTTSGAKIVKDTLETLVFEASTVTTGEPQAKAKYVFGTSVDRPLPLTDAKETVVLGGTLDKTDIADIAFVTDGDKVPGTLNTGKINIIFAKVITEIPIGGKITLALPRNYFTKVDETKDVTLSTTGAKAKCVRTAGTIGTKVFEIDDADTIVCTTSGAKIPKDALKETLTFEASTVTTGEAQAKAKYNVGTSVDKPHALTDCKETAPLGDILTTSADLSFESNDFKAVDTVPGTLNTGTITFTFTTGTELPIGGKVTIAVPRNYFSKVDESKVATFKTKTGSATCALTAGVVGITVDSIAHADTIICTTSTKVEKGATALIFPAGSLTTGVAQAAAKYNVDTSVDRKFADSDRKDMAALGAKVTDGVAMAFTNADDTIPGKFSTNNNTITFKFSTGTALAIGSKITITLPPKYFSKVDGTKDNTIGTTATAKCALANSQSTVQAVISSDKTTVSTSGAVLTVSIIPATAFGVTQFAIPLAGFSLDDSFTVECSVNCAKTDKGKVTVTLANSVLTVTLASDNSITAKNTLTTFKITGVKTPAALGYATSGISGTLFNPSATVVCTTAGAAIAKTTVVSFTFVSGSVTIGAGQKASTFQVETSTDLQLDTAIATVALGGGLSGGKPLAFANAQDAIPGKVNSGPITLGATLTTSVPIGGQFLLTFPSNYFTAVNPASAVTLTKGTRRSLLQSSTLSCVRVAGTTTDQITCTLAGAASGTGAVVLTFPAGSLTTGLPTSTSGGFNVATANPPAASAARVPYFPKAAGSAYGVAWLLVALSALLACF